jgi:hypothetical protein
MREKAPRMFAALLLATAAGGAGYMLGMEGGETAVSIPEQILSAPSANSVRIIYSLDKKQNDQEIISLIDEAEERVYFAIYVFTLENIADALIAAKQRGVDVRGITDSGEAKDINAAIVRKLLAAKIPLVTEKHENGTGIMHIKLLVTEKAYATGSYNWTKSATNSNDELLEIGTDKALRQTYENILKKLLEAYKGNSAAKAADSVSIGTIPFTKAKDHVGDWASVTGTVVRVYTSNTNTTFINFCEDYKTCPFSAVVFSSDAKKFGDLTHLVGKQVTLSGKISSYEGRAEIILSNPSQLSQ